MSSHIHARNQLAANGVTAMALEYPTIRAWMIPIAQNVIVFNSLKIIEDQQVVLRAGAPIMKSFIYFLVAVAVSGCAHAGNEALVPSSCQKLPATHVGSSVTFKGEVGETTIDALHLDFDDHGADFSSVRFTFVSPLEWKGISVPLYYQGEIAIAEGRQLSSGELLSFTARVPGCLDAPWLFLEEIKPQLFESSALGDGRN